MRVAVLYEPHADLKIEELDVDDPKEGEVKLRMVGGGVCHSDYHRIDGHSAIGAAVTTLSPGDHVVLSLTSQCGRCRNCAAGRANLDSLVKSLCRSN